MIRTRDPFARNGFFTTSQVFFALEQVARFLVAPVVSPPSGHVAYRLAVGSTIPRTAIRTPIARVGLRATVEDIVPPLAKELIVPTLPK